MVTSNLTEHPQPKFWRNEFIPLVGGLFFLFVVTVFLRFVGQAAFHGEPPFQMTSGNFILSRTPDWIDRQRLLADVLNEPGLSTDVSLLTPLLADKLAVAFHRQPTIKEVKRVSILPSGTIQVEVEYRKPVCLIAGTSGYWPVDVTGTLLPSDFFARLGQQSPETLLNYVRSNGILLVRGVSTLPIGGIGEPWGDTLVEQVARTAELLQPVTPKLGLTRLHIVMEDRPSGGTGRGGFMTFRLFTHNDSEIVWGRPNQIGLDDSLKLQFMLEVAEYYGTLDDIPKHPLRLDIQPFSLPLAMQ